MVRRRLLGCGDSLGEFDIGLLAGGGSAHEAAQALGPAGNPHGADALHLGLEQELHRLTDLVLGGPSGHLEHLDVLFPQELALLREEGLADHVEDLGHGFTTSWRARTASLEKITWSYLRSS